jgi:hypothetical protein
MSDEITTSPMDWMCFRSHPFYSLTWVGEEEMGRK